MKNGTRLSRLLPVMALTCTCVLAVSGVQDGRRQRGSASPAPGSALYDADPNHIWNRVHRQLRVRTAAGNEEYGDDEVDPLLWRETKYLVTEPSHSEAVGLLDEFLNTGAERLVGDALKRAVFQHDLWAVFDWAAEPTYDYQQARRALAVRLARIIRRVALTRSQIERLPDTYEAAVTSGAFPGTYDPGRRERAFLPRDLFDADGAWVGISGDFVPVALEHAGSLSHSSFSVFFSVPGGARDTLAYLKALWDFPQPYVTDPFGRSEDQRAATNPALPPLPPGSRAALVRTMLLIDDRGAIIPSRVTEGIQLRVFHAFGNQHFSELQIRRRRLFAGESGGLHAIRPDEQGFITFSAEGTDVFEAHPSPRLQHRRPVLEGCRNCHFDIPLREPRALPDGHAIRSVRRLLKPYGFDPRRETWRFDAAAWKTRRYEWGLMQGLWQSNPR